MKVIIWCNYGLEGWKPCEFNTAKEAADWLRDCPFHGEKKITREFKLVILDPEEGLDEYGEKLKDMTIREFLGGEKYIAYWSLGYGGIKTVGDLILSTEKKLRRIRDVGDTTVKKVLRRMHEYGLRFKGRDDE